MYRSYLDSVTCMFLLEGFLILMWPPCEVLAFGPDPHELTTDPSSTLLGKPYSSESCFSLYYLPPAPICNSWSLAQLLADIWQPGQQL
ncbi:hypothetical protein FKM82_005313 [Ascaphus truei]